MGVQLLALGGAQKSLRSPAEAREDLSYKRYFTMAVKRECEQTETGEGMAGRWD